MIYFIEAKEVGRVKIGWTNNLKGRLEALQTASPCRLEITLLLSGDMKRERELHEQFKEHRLHGEWFNVSLAITAFIEANKPFSMSYIDGHWMPKEEIKQEEVKEIMMEEIAKTKPVNNIFRGVPIHKQRKKRTRVSKKQAVEKREEKNRLDKVTKELKRQNRE